MMMYVLSVSDVSIVMCWLVHDVLVLTGCLMYMDVCSCCVVVLCVVCCVFFFQAEDGIRDLVRSRGLGDVYKRQVSKAFCKISLDTNSLSVLGEVQYAMILKSLGMISMA